MKRSLSISVFLLLALGMFTFSGLSQAGGGSDPSPPNPRKAPLSDNQTQTEIVLDGTLVLNNRASSLEDKIGFVRNVSQSLLQAERISIVYRVEDGGSALSQLSEGEVVVREVRYQKVAFDLVREGFFDGVKDFLVTDGKRYFRIVLGRIETRLSSDTDGQL